MASITRLLAVAILLSGLLRCGHEATPSAATSHGQDTDVQASPSLAQRLLVNLNDRKTWPSNGVKIWLSNPTVSVILSLPHEDPVEIHAWPGNENDFNVAMMRLDRGQSLYAITDDEFQALKERQGSTASPAPTVAVDR